MKKILTVLMAVLIAFCSFTVCMAEAVGEKQPADVLYNLGLFNGTGTDADGKPIFNLENQLSRQEAAALLVRLLGKEAEAQKEILATPFTDVADWAKPYVGYAYNQGLVNGTGATSFGSENPISATEYLTLILRTLGHDDKQGDFVWNSAWTLSDALGMTNGQYNADTNAVFCRKDAVLISYMSLLQKIKGGEQTLANKLLEDGAFSAEQLAGTNDAELIKAAASVAPETPVTGNQVAPVTGITFEQRGVYVKMTITQPEDKTGIVGYEALIYNKNNPEEAVHRSIKLEDGTAHYRLDDPMIFAIGQEFNAIKVTSNGAEGYAPAFWESDISVVPVQKDITVTEAWVVSDSEIDLNLADVEKGYMGYVFTRKDETVIDEDSFLNYMGGTAKFRGGLEKWSAEDKKALENGEVSVSMTGMNILKMTDAEGSWKIEFERIKSPKTVVKCEVDIVK